MVQNRLPPHEPSPPDVPPPRPVGFDSPELSERPLPPLLRDIVRGRIRRTLDPDLGQLGGRIASEPLPLTGEQRAWMADRFEDTFGRKSSRPPVPSIQGPLEQADASAARSEVPDESMAAVEADLRFLWSAGVPLGDAYYHCESLLRRSSLAGRMPGPRTRGSHMRDRRLREQVARVMAARLPDRVRGEGLHRLLVADRGSNSGTPPRTRLAPALSGDIRLIRSAGLDPRTALRAETILLRQAMSGSYAAEARPEDPGLRECLRADLASLKVRHRAVDSCIIPAFHAVVLLDRYRDGRYVPGRDLGRVTEADRSRWQPYWLPWNPKAPQDN